MVVGLITNHDRLAYVELSPLGLHRLGFMEPQISVLMSCFNAEQWLAESLQSVLTQTHQNFEFIIVDDGSSDGTARIIRDYAAQDYRIKPIFKHNTGLPDSLNVGLAQAQAPWIARLDADDIAEPTRLAEQLEFVRTHPQVVLVGTAFTEIDGQGDIIAVHHMPTANHQIKANLVRGRHYLIHSSTLYSRDAVNKVGGYRPRARLAEDLDLWLRLSSENDFACIDKPLIRYRKHLNQISRDQAYISKKQLTDSLMVVMSHYLRLAGLPDPVDSEDESAWLSFKVWLEARVDQSQVFEYVNAWTKARENYFSQNNRLVGGLLSLKQLLRSGHAGTLIWIKLFGSDLPKRFAQEWCHESKSKVSYSLT
jgi:glycosyltransferase involved in cell wall biosynthesis